MYTNILELVMSLNLQKPFSLNVLKIFREYTMIKTNTMPIFNIDTTILLKLCSFVWFFYVSRSKNSCSQKKHVHIKWYTKWIYTEWIYMKQIYLKLIYINWIYKKWIYIKWIIQSAYLHIRFIHIISGYV